MLLGLIALGLVTVTQCHLLGGWSEVDLGADSASNEGLTSAANWATARISLSRNSNRRLKLIQITHAKTQVVSGTNYEMTVKLGETDCLKSEEAEPANCEHDPRQGHHQLLCKTIIYNQPWTGTTRFLETNDPFNCEDLV